MRIQRWTRRFLLFSTLWFAVVVYSETSSTEGRPDTSRIGSIVALVEFEVVPAPSDPPITKQQLLPKKSVTPTPKLLTSKATKTRLPILTAKESPSKEETIHKPAQSPADVVVVKKKEFMSTPTAIMNVLADLCPHGMLPMAYGMAAAGGTGVVLSTIVLLVFGVFSWYSLVSFGRAADVVLIKGDGDQKSVTMEGESLSAVWSQVFPRAKFTRYLPDVGCVLLTGGCLLYYSALLGNIFGSLLSGVKSLPPILSKPWALLLLLHGIAIVPLCLKTDLSSRKYSSMIGVGGVLFSTFFVTKRLFDGSYGEGGKFFQLMPSELKPISQPHYVPVPVDRSSFNEPVYLTDLFSLNMVYGSNEKLDVIIDEGRKVFRYVNELFPLRSGKGLLMLLNMCCVAYCCHYNAVPYFMELKNRQVSTLGGVMGAGIGGTTLVFWCMMVFGYATFGANAQSIFLNNYHNSRDVMATIARACAGVAIISAYALMFSGFQTALFSLLRFDVAEKNNNIPTNSLIIRKRAISLISLASIAMGACFVKENELRTIIGIIGSILGSAVIYVIPAILNNRLLQMTDKRGNFRATSFFPGETIFNHFMIALGVVLAILGTWISLGDQSY